VDAVVIEIRITSDGGRRFLLVFLK